MHRTNRQTVKRRAAMAAILAVGWLAVAAGRDVENWPQWRGPHANGTSSTARDLPVRWSQTENVVWRVSLPSWSAATPAVWEDTVFVTSAEEGFSVPPVVSGGQRGRPVSGEANTKDQLFLLALSRKDGKEIWKRSLGGGNRIYRKQNLSSPSPITDGQHVWIMTGTGVFACFDFKGNQIWRRDIQKDYGRFGLNHGYASSPLLHEDRLYVQVLHGMTTDDPSYVFAVDKKTGKTIWKVERPTDAVHESPDNYATPMLATVNGKLELVISGADYVTGHDMNSGRELWRLAGLNPNKDRAYRTIASVIILGDTVYVSSTRGRPFVAFRAGGSGDITESNVLWKNDLGPDVPTPTTDGKRIYIIADNGLATALDAKDGRIIWNRQRIEPGTYSSSPLLADGKIYATSEDGTTTVLKAGDTFEILAVNKLDSHTLASPIAVGNQLFIRTADYLYCIANKQ